MTTAARESRHKLKGSFGRGIMEGSFGTGTPNRNLFCVSRHKSAATENKARHSKRSRPIPVSGLRFLQNAGWETEAGVVEWQCRDRRVRN